MPHHELIGKIMMNTAESDSSQDPSSGSGTEKFQKNTSACKIYM